MRVISRTCRRFSSQISEIEKGPMAHITCVSHKEFKAAYLSRVPGTLSTLRLRRWNLLENKYDRGFLARPALWRASFIEEARPHAGCCPVARSGHRGEHCYLQPD